MVCGYCALLGFVSQVRPNVCIISKFWFRGFGALYVYLQNKVLFVIISILPVYEKLLIQKLNLNVINGFVIFLTLRL